MCATFLSHEFRQLPVLCVCKKRETLGKPPSPAVDEDVPSAVTSQQLEMDCDIIVPESPEAGVTSETQTLSQPRAESKGNCVDMI